MTGSGFAIAESIVFILMLFCPRSVIFCRSDRPRAINAEASTSARAAIDAGQKSKILLRAPVQARGAKKVQGFVARLIVSREEFLEFPHWLLRGLQ